MIDAADAKKTAQTVAESKRATVMARVEESIKEAARLGSFHCQVRHGLLDTELSLRKEVIETLQRLGYRANWEIISDMRDPDSWLLISWD